MCFTFEESKIKDNRTWCNHQVNNIYYFDKTFSKFDNHWRLIHIFSLSKNFHRISRNFVHFESFSIAIWNNAKKNDKFPSDKTISQFLPPTKSPDTSFIPSRIKLNTLGDDQKTGPRCTQFHQARVSRAKRTHRVFHATRWAESGDNATRISRFPRENPALEKLLFRVNERRWIRIVLVNWSVIHCWSLDWPARRSRFIR